MYLVFGGWSVYMLSMSKYDPGSTTLGKVVIWHGRFFISCLIGSAILGMAFTFAVCILRFLGIEIGG